MSYDRKTSRRLISELCASNEFKMFKDSLEGFSMSLEGESFNELVKSINNIKKTEEDMMFRINTMLKYTVDSYLTEEQIKEIEMESDDKGVALSYKHYIPIYISEEGVYTSIDSCLLIINFEKKHIYVKDLFKVFDEASRCSKSERLRTEARLDMDMQKISDMEKNRVNSAYVVNEVNKYNKQAIRSKTFEKIKCMISKNAYAEYLAAFDDILDELREDTYFRREQLRKEKQFDYEGKYEELLNLQKSIISKLADMNFEVEYEEDVKSMVEDIVNIKNLYRL